MGVSIFLALFYMISGSLFPFPYWEKMGIAKEGLDSVFIGWDVPFGLVV